MDDVSFSLSSCFISLKDSKSIKLSAVIPWKFLNCCSISAATCIKGLSLPLVLKRAEGFSIRAIVVSLAALSASSLLFPKLMSPAPVPSLSLFASILSLICSLIFSLASPILFEIISNCLI